MLQFQPSSGIPTQRGELPSVFGRMPPSFSTSSSTTSTFVLPGPATGGSTAPPLFQIPSQAAPQFPLPSFMTSGSSSVSGFGFAPTPSGGTGYVPSFSRFTPTPSPTAIQAPSQPIPTFQFPSQNVPSFSTSSVFSTPSVPLFPSTKPSVFSAPSTTSTQATFQLPSTSTAVPSFVPFTGSGPAFPPPAPSVFSSAPTQPKQETFQLPSTTAPSFVLPLPPTSAPTSSSTSTSTSTSTSGLHLPFNLQFKVPSFLSSQPPSPRPSTEAKIFIPLDPSPSASYKPLSGEWDGTPGREIGTGLKSPIARMLISMTNDQVLSLKETIIQDYVCLARIINVVDGDTADVAIFIPLSFFTTTNEKGEVKLVSKEVRTRRKKGEPKRHLTDVDIPNSWITDKKGIIARTRLRFLEIDAAEKNTKQGLSAREEVKKWAEEHGWFAIVRFVDKEKFGRNLAVIYPPSEAKSGTLSFKDSLNNHILTYKDKTLGTVAHAYGGERRQQWGSLVKK